MNGDPANPLLRPVLYSPVLVEDVTIPGAEIIHARIYRPQAAGQFPGLVVLHGMYYQGIDNDILKNNATWLASCGLVVLTPDLAELREYQIDHTSIEKIGRAARWLAKQTGGPVGLMGNSFSGGLTLVAASEPETAPSVKFVFTMGAFDDMSRVANSYVNGYERSPRGRVSVSPLKYGMQVIAYIGTNQVIPPRDRAALKGVLRAKLSSNIQSEKQLMDALTVVQRAEFKKLMSPAILAEAIAKSRSSMDAISPHSHVKELRAPVFILHGENDQVISSAESEWLCRDLPPGKLQSVIITPIITHVSMGNESHTLRQRWELLHLFARVIRTAEAR
jgi:acetyl esterase/lipase